VASSVQPGARYQYTHDVLGRALSLAYYDAPTDTWSTRAQAAPYNAAGQITSWQESPDGSSFSTLTRSYDVRTL